MEKFVVFNPTHGNVSFVIFPSTIANSVVHMASHKRRRLVRGKATPVNVPSRHSVDLVEATGFSIKEIKETVELHQFIRHGVLVVLEDSSSPKPIPMPVLPDTVKAIPAPVLPPVVEEVKKEESKEEVKEEPMLDFHEVIDPVEKEDKEEVEKVIVEDLEILANSKDESDNLKEEPKKPIIKKKSKGKALFKKKK